MKHPLSVKLLPAVLWHLLLLAGTSLVAQSYSYLPTIKEGNRWKFDAYIGMGGLITVDYHLHGDTIVAGKSYLKVVNENNAFLGAMLREDTLTKKIYKINQNSASQEFLLYDFDLKLGDTIQGSVVSGVDTTFLFGRNRRLIKFNSPDYCRCSLIEGVGSTYVGVWAPTCAPIYVWFFSEGMSPSTEVEDKSNLFNVFPNPSSDYIYISAKDSSALKYQYSLYDIYGKLGQTGNLNIQDLTVINVQTLSPGLYFIKITDDQLKQKGLLKVFVE